MANNSTLTSTLDGSSVTFVDEEGDVNIRASGNTVLTLTVGNGAQRFKDQFGNIFETQTVTNINSEDYPDGIELTQQAASNDVTVTNDTTNPSGVAVNVFLDFDSGGTMLGYGSSTTIPEGFTVEVNFIISVTQTRYLYNATTNAYIGTLAGNSANNIYQLNDLPEQVIINNVAP